MKVGKPLPELAAQIKREQKAKRDFVAPTDHLEYVEPSESDDSPLGMVQFSSHGNQYRVAPTHYCLRQIGSRCNIPAAYVDRMVATDKEGNYRHIGLLAENVNWWWDHQPENRMLRCLISNNGQHQRIARAFLSDRYRPLDNADLAEVVLPKIADAGCEVLSAEITEKRLYVQAATPRIEFDVNAFRKSGKKLSEADPVQAGVIISNSEVGAGSLRVEPLLWRLSCLNGLIAAHSIKRYHIGREIGDPLFELEAAAEYFTDKTKRQDDKAFWMKVRDVVEGIFDKGKFESLVQKFAETGDVRLPNGVEAVEEVANRFKLQEAEKNSVLNYLIEGGDLSVYGLVNAVTRTSTDVESYDRAVELERVGGQIIELPQNVWK